ncbi:IS110 family transposase [Paenibacillus montaniterrae]|uniref:IS110 family transposase n=1 Tax=Paenibacillus montaniterrae TaxID=429341 RepID=A0A919YN28_9BACL|nr:IS110 family transposase [Paenibacillus montaniterrae]GIP16212.1 IS110 family transposase [Paenibacillus montaniterrae]
MDAILERCAGLDVHQESVVACVLSGPLDKRPRKEIKTFGTTTNELLNLLDWLTDRACTHVAMESTGVYWKPVWNILQESFTLVLANAKKIKNVPGRKTDVKDSEWIAKLLRCGLIEPSFVPPEAIRELRDYTRYRRKLIGDSTAEKNRIHKILQDANIKLTTFVSDVFGASGRRLLDAVVNGEVLEPETVRRLVFTKLKKKVPSLIEALNGRIRAHHRAMIRMHLDHLDYLEQCIGELEQRIDELLCPYQEEIRLLITIPGVQKDTAASILAEIGTDMTVFPTEDHLASWAGVSPGNHESAGQKKSSKTNKGNKGLKSALCQAAWAAMKSRKTRLSSFYYRIVKRRGPKKANMALAHLLLRIIYHMLMNQVPYHELGWNYQQKHERDVEYWVNKMKALGYHVQIQPMETA